MVGTALAFWMRNVRAWATAGARLMPSAPNVPRAAETPPESLTKSRGESAPRVPKPASSLGGGTGAGIGAGYLLIAIVERHHGVVNLSAYTPLLSGAGLEAYTASGRVGRVGTAL